MVEILIYIFQTKHARAEVIFRGLGMSVVAGCLHLGRYIGYWEAESTWLDEKGEGVNRVGEETVGSGTQAPAVHLC